MKISLAVDGRIRANAYSVHLGNMGEKLRQRRPIGEVFAREVWSEEAGIAA
jgi:hypothetical protein